MLLAEGILASFAYPAASFNRASVPSWFERRSGDRSEGKTCLGTSHDVSDESPEWF
jgi:hypothetical protein